MHHMGLLLVCACFRVTNSLETSALKKKCLVKQNLSVAFDCCSSKGVLSRS